MAGYKVRVSEKEGIFDAIGEGILKDVRDLPVKGVREARFGMLYYLEGDINDAQAKRIAEELLIDKITQEYFLDASDGRGTIDARRWNTNGYKTVEIAYNPGVMDPVEESLLKALKDMGISGVSSVRTAKEYMFKGDISDAALRGIAEKLLYNKVIQHIVRREARDEGRGTRNEVDYKFRLITVDLLKASDKRLKEISRQGQLFLNLAEMRQIQGYFKKLGRNPTDCELETIAQTWSEHCRHKTFRGKIEYTEEIRNPCLAGRQAKS